jgi:hypothetical protein
MIALTHANDALSVQVVEGNVIVDYDSLAMLAFDEDGNVRCFKYDPGSIKVVYLFVCGVIVVLLRLSVLASCFCIF